MLLTVLFKQFLHFRYDDRVFPTYLCYFLLGALFGRHYTGISAWLRRALPLLGAIFVPLAAANAILTVRAEVYGASFPAFETLHLFYSLAAIAFFLSVSLKASDRFRTLPRPILLADKASYYVYLSHILPIYIANDLLLRWGITDLFSAFLFRALFTYTVTFALCIGYTLLKERFYRK